MAYPKSKDKKIQKLSNVLVKYTEREGIEFSFGGNDLYPVEALSFFGGLSLFLIEAKENYEKIYNNLYTVQDLMSGIGKDIRELNKEDLEKEEEYLSKITIEKRFPIDFIQEEDTFFGFVPRISQTVPCDFSLLSHFAHYSLEEYLRIYKNNKMLLIDGKVPLDPLYEKMVEKLKNNKIKIIATSNFPKNISEN